MLTDPNPDIRSGGVNQILTICLNAQEPTQPAVFDDDGWGVSLGKKHAMDSSGR